MGDKSNIGLRIQVKIMDKYTAHELIIKANELLKNGDFEYAFCGGFAIELFLNRTIRKHGDIDVSAYWYDRDKIIPYMQSLGWNVYEMCGGGIAHHITDVKFQIKAKRNIFCFKDGCSLVKLSPHGEIDMYYLDFDHSGQTKLDFIEFLFNNRNADSFLYARNENISQPIKKAILTRDRIPYLAPELVLLYKSTDPDREDYQLDYDSVKVEMSVEQRDWLDFALKAMNPSGHKWLEKNAPHKDGFWSAVDTLIAQQLDFPIEAVCFQEGETCVAMWATADKIREMMEAGEFLGKQFYPYFDEMMDKWG